MNKEKRMYIRDENRNPKGVVVMIQDEQGKHFGYSLVDTDKYNWDRDRAMTIARNRALSKEAAISGKPLEPKLHDRRKVVLDHWTKLEA